ncbi:MULTISPECIES: urea carboxylase [Caballeronia]|uniref:Urea carboxylase n=1 Tax=Caballeronia zhejiangensis TaxID=871203 RepID=A0A656QW13_9BURK|nr:MULTISPECIES: urea carboxylase [Caballeronia]EKS70927.1 urea carboxylase [Burkholderia sp. SJ98]KDR33958.1 urea carboxylase [Caballeronia zhejiangensis]MDR5788833.1 urea carboxylase [Caballeronia sp. LP003]
MFEKILIANRGAIACRILRTLRALDVTGIAVYAEADRASRHVSEASIAHSLGDGPAATTYLDTAKILDIARAEGVQAIHPGYGFLSENAAFGEACEAAGIAFIGPTPAQLRAFGLKHTAREIAAKEGVPMLEGTGLLDDLPSALAAAERIGYPVMLKSTAGGGGIGMRVCWNAGELGAHFDAVRRLGENNFSDAGVFLEKYIERARHLEVQVFGDGQGDAIALGVRDCSVQRRNQKVLEETPAPSLPEGVSAALCDAAIRLAKAVDYRSAGTVEFVYDSAAERFYFLEVNTRLQVEHGVTEQVWGVDLVRWMIELAAGTLAPLSSLMAGLKPRGHAIQARLYAEDPGRDFKPSPGLVTDVAFPVADGRALRIDTWIEAGCEVPPYFDPMLAKIIAWSPTRDQARHALDEALANTRLYGVETNRDYLRQIIGDAPFASGEPWTRCLEALKYRASTIDVASGGTQTTVQDYPGRLGYWAVGIPPSGPMDDRSMRLGNRLIGNAADAAALEVTMSGPTLRFNTDAVIAITGADIPVTLDDIAQPMHTSIHVAAGSTLALGTIRGAGARAYLCVRGGFDVASYLGSRSTFTLGQFGGHGGRAIRAGDVLHVYPLGDAQAGATLGDALRLEPVRTIRVIYGPHGAPEYFSAAYIERFFDTEWEVHFNSSRTGVRLIGPKPEWAREDGGEAGLHPSNIHDNPYAVGAIDFTGDMPVILGPDGPSLGGFVCPVTIIEADLWQIGQLKAGDKVRFLPVEIGEARRAARRRRREIESLDIERGEVTERRAALTSPIVLDSGSGRERLVARVSGDTHLLLEIGPAELDLVSRFRGHALMQSLESQALPGVVDLTPGIRSLQIHYRPDDLPLARLLAIVEEAWAQVLLQGDLRVPSRIVHLPLSWDDPACRLAIDKYMTTVRKDAPWCPSNLEFIRRINDLDSIDAVRKIVFDASYLVMGLGDVYLGAPVATPLDPRHRLVTTKYNPARTWTAENSVGIGGAYLCVYGMEGPGGYQFVGRTLQMWNRYAQTADFCGQHYLLRFFDQIRFYEVSADELMRIRADFPLGRYPLRIEETELSLPDYQAFLADEASSIDAFRTRQQAAFQAERERWREAGASEDAQDAPLVDDTELAPLKAGELAIDSEIAGSLWQVKAAPGDEVAAGDVLLVIESMKMEIAVCAPCAGTVAAIHVAPGSPLRAGQRIAVIERH